MWCAPSAGTTSSAPLVDAAEGTLVPERAARSGRRGARRWWRAMKRSPTLGDPDRGPGAPGLDSGAWPLVLLLAGLHARAARSRADRLGGLLLAVQSRRRRSGQRRARAPWRPATRPRAAAEFLKEAGGERARHRLLQRRHCGAAGRSLRRGARRARPRPPSRSIPTCGIARSTTWALAVCSRPRRTPPSGGAPGPGREPAARGAAAPALVGAGQVEPRAGA